MIRIWYGLHQLDLVMQQIFKSALDDEFHTTLTRLIGILRRQQNLINAMKSTCLKVADTRWLFMSSVTSWLTSNLMRVITYVNKKKPACAPSLKWWLFLHGVHAFSLEASEAFKSLQGLATLLSQQRLFLERFVSTYREMTQIVGPLTREHIASLDAEQYVVCGSFELSLDYARSSLDELGPWVLQTLDSLEDVDRNDIVRFVASMFVQAASKISDIVAEREGQNQAGIELPPVLPTQLVKINMHMFVDIMNQHMNRLTHSFSTELVKIIGIEYSNLLRAYRSDTRLRSTSDACAETHTSFAEAWAVVGDSFAYLCEFFGGLASCFSNNATVESNFSVIA